MSAIALTAKGQTRGNARMNKADAVKWLNNLKNDIGNVRHSDLWHYAEAIDDAISVLNECEEIVHCKGCRYRSSYGECCRFDDWNPHETGDRDLLGLQAL